MKKKDKDKKKVEQNKYSEKGRRKAISAIIKGGRVNVLTNHHPYFNFNK